MLIADLSLAAVPRGLSIGAMTELLRIQNLTVDLPAGADRRHAIHDLSLSIQAGEIVCVVGESG
ncbi:hypothetical protein ACLI1X_16515, partial [Enterococcus faecalis]